MEATSARMARDRFGGFAEPATTPLQRYIQNACDPQNYQPNIALNMEIVDMVNQKKGSAPREAAISIVTHVNNRNPNISLLSLSLLDNCVKNCGYPFHLQISTKEFLNELVRRFPERPPFRYSRVQSKILELIEEWRTTICMTSKYKDDLGFIRDMHRLLSYKGYIFPEVKREDAAVLNPSDTLQSAEEMQEEERAAQSAKLQELIRRGTPHDLQEANRLMKVMAGYDQRHKVDYRAKAAEEVSRVQQKAKILEEMLQNHKEGDDLGSDSWEELGNALSSAQPKIQKMCEEESDDHEAVAKLFEINDSIHRTLERYQLVKKGDLQGAAKIPKGTLGTSGAGIRQGAGGELSLIDFGGPEENQDPISSSISESQAAPTSNGNILENDLLGLSMQDGPSISLGGPTYTSTPANASPNQQRKSNADILSAFGSAPSSSSPAPAMRALSGQQQPNTFIQQPFQQPFLQQQQRQPPSDPFGSLQSARGISPAPFQSSLPSQPTSTSASASATASDNNANSLLDDLSSFTAPTPPPKPISQPQSNKPPEEDEWTYSSSLPPSIITPPTKELTLTNTSINITFSINPSPQPPDSAVLISSTISNNTPTPITDLRFEMAVMKGYRLDLRPQSGRELAGRQRNGIAQEIRLLGWVPGRGGVKVRWKVGYLLGGERKEESGMLDSLGLS